MEIAAGILVLLLIACNVLMAHYLKQIRNELREMNGKGKAQNPSRANRYGMR